MATNFRVWILASRPKTLWAAASPVIIGMAVAYRDGVFHGLSGFLALLAALLIQVGTNFYNDYRDFETGTDTEARKGPVRAVLAGLVSPGAMKRATILVFALAVAAGAYLMWRGGWPVVVIGATSILFGVLYTGGRFSLASLGLADLFVFVFFGPVAVAGTYFVQALAWSPAAVLAGVAPGLLSVAILTVNNVRDVEEDGAQNRKTLVVRFGRAYGVAAYIASILIASLIPLGLFLWFDGPLLALATVLILPLSIPSIRTMVETTVAEGARLNDVLAATGRLLLVYSLLFSAGWMAG